MRWWEPWLFVLSGTGIAVIGAFSQSSLLVVAGFVVMDLSLIDAGWRLSGAGELAHVSPRPPRPVGATLFVLLATGVTVLGGILFVRGVVVDTPLNVSVIALALFAAAPTAGLLAGVAFWSRRTSHAHHMFQLSALMGAVFFLACLGTVGMAMTAGFGRVGMTANRVAIEYSVIWLSGVGAMVLLGAAVATIRAAISSFAAGRFDDGLR